MTTLNALSSLEQNLGAKHVYDLLEFALPVIQDRGQRLQEALDQEDWELAAKIAHQTCSSVRLYGSQHFEMLLRSIMQKDLPYISSVKFKHELTVELKSVLTSIDEWLSAASFQ